MSSVGDTEKAMIETVRAIEDHLALLPSSVLERWKGIFVTAAHKVDAELNSTMMHRCDICGDEEYGYRTELPALWYIKGELTICHKHESDEVLAEETSEPETTVEQTLDELLAMV